MDTRYRVRHGAAFPLGATWLGGGTNFALYSESASAVDLCFFDDGRETRVRLPQRTDAVWHGYVEGVGPGQAYGYRVEGPWDPERGLRHNARCVLLDPYAKALAGVEDWSRGGFSHDVVDQNEDLVRAECDQRGAPLGIVTDPSFDWGDDAPPDIRLRNSLIYEAHVKAMTARHPGVAPELRGTYLGLASEPIVDHLRELGVTAVELLPVFGFVDDPFRRERGIRASSACAPIAFFAPDVRYRSGKTVGAEVRQFKRLVKTLHAAGIEVLLDVGYEHTAEGDHRGPTLSFKGIDNRTYYRLAADNPRYYADPTGAGNTLNVHHPQTMRLVMDSLRYWVQEMHVDGFRLGRVPALARTLHDVDRLASFFAVIHQDPILGRVKLIGAPSTVGGDGDGGEARRLPARWAEWNGRYRDTVRAFWVGDAKAPPLLGLPGELARQLTGTAASAGGAGDRGASVHFVASHEGGTLRDLVTAGGEPQAAEAEDAGARALRGRQMRNLLATLLLSPGTPMIRAGDELGHTHARGRVDGPGQRGLAEAAYHEDEVTWIDWELDKERRTFLAFARAMTAVRRAHPLLRRANFVRPNTTGGSPRDVVWMRHDGQLLSEDDRNRAATSGLELLVAASGLEPLDEDRANQSDDDLLVLLNGGDEDLPFVFPAAGDGGRAVLWELVVDTADDRAREHVEPGTTTRMRARSLKLFSRRPLGPGGLRAVHGVPTSTYRLQLQPTFGFRDAAAVLDYLDDLGVGGVYTSPYFRAQPGSTHGYDVVDHASLNSELGSDDDYHALTDGIRARRMQHLVDFVPNHVGIGSSDNRAWNDVLESGPSSAYADWFDIAWDAASTGEQGKVLLPVLGAQFGEEIDAGKVTIARDGGSFYVEYGGKRLPASPRSYALVIARARAGEAQLDGPGADVLVQELESIHAAIGHLPPASATTRRERGERQRETDVVKRRLAALCGSSPAVAGAIDAAAAAISESPERMERFLFEQNYRLSYWRVASEEINYRRFFDVNELAAIRMEEPDVFAEAHARLLELVAEGRVTGIRLDHTDGLYDPYAYFQTLQRELREALRRGGVDGEEPMYVTAEKIIEHGEEVPRSWAISGTTGYEFLGVAGGLWVDPAAEPAFTRLYAEITGEPVDFRAVARQGKRDVMEASFASEISVLSELLKRIAERDRHARDFTRATLTRVIKETIAAFSVYRTYLRPDGSREEDDETRIARAIALARRDSPVIEGSTFDFLERVLLLRERGDAAVRFTMRFQQLTGPVMAKGVEDTAFYRYVRLVCLNEVGADPYRFGTSVNDFHAHNAAALALHPLSMTTTSTHDTKRGEDVRARIAVLSELPEEWSRFVREVREACAPWVGTAQGSEAPSPGDAYLFHQTVVGAFPFEGIGDDAALGRFTDRLAAYMKKASYEAKVRTSWTSPNAEYDRALDRFVRGALGAPGVRALFEAFVGRIASHGATNSLAQLALRLASPGVPDVYQGCETWSLSLVDPDNRQPVDFAGRRQALADLRARGEPTPELARDLVASFADGRIKLHVSRIGLRLRREIPALFLDAAYEPLEGTEHVVAFQRSLHDRRLVCVVPRLTARLTRGERPWALAEAWGDVRLKLPVPGRYRNVFTGERLDEAKPRMADVLRRFPVAWLVND
jgi:(1->4)-alpha-D-glucan 1-alpha-D-glucosylmutase